MSPSVDGAPRWFALQIRPHTEKVTSLTLSLKGYPVLLPAVRRPRRWSDRNKKVEFPLFPGYVFCRFDSSGTRMPLLTTPNVIRLVGIGKEPEPIPDSEIEALKRIAESDALVEPCDFIPVGERVRVEMGPLAGLEGIIARYQNEQRVIVSVTLLQQSAAVNVDRCHIRPVEEPRRDWRIPVHAREVSGWDRGRCATGSNR